jgi:hypothetical protein
LLGIDHQGLLSIYKAGDHTALHKGFGSYPLKTLAPIAAGAGLLALAAAWLWRNEPTRSRPASATGAAGPPVALSA